MAVVDMATALVKPDRFEDFVETARRFKALFDGYGGVSCRLLSAVVGGEATGTVAFVTEVDDWAAFGALMQKLYSDPDAMALLSSTISSDGPGVDGSTQVSLWMDVPL